MAITPTDLSYVVAMDSHWDGTNRGKTLTEEIGFDIDSYAANGWTRPFFDDFDGTAVGSCPANVTDEALPKTGTHHWWSYGRGPTGSGGAVTPAFTRPDMTTNQYQIRSASVMGMGAVRLPSFTQGGVTYSGIFATTNMQTQRRGSNKIPAAAPGTWSYTDNLSYSHGYGYYEAKMKCPRFRGSWPAFWLISDDEYYASMAPRIEIDIVELYLSDTGEDGVSHHVCWLHKPQTAWIQPGWNQFDRGWSGNSAPGIDNTNRYEDDSLKKWDDGFHTFGMLMKPDATAPNGIGWFIFYVDRIENCRLPLISEWVRKYYLILSLQSQAPFQQETTAANAAAHQAAGKFYNYMDPYVQYWLEIDHVGCWSNPAWPTIVHEEPYFPPALTDTVKTINIPRLERQMALKTGIPLNGVVQVPEHGSTDTPPQMDPFERFIVVEGENGSIGTVAVNNTPTNPVKYRLHGEGAEDFTIDEDTGEISAAGTLSVVQNYDLAVIASDYPLVPCLPGTNITKVYIEVREDATFDLSYWRRGAVAPLRVWLDAQDADTYDIENTNQIAAIRDKSTYLLEWNQTTTTKRPLLNATGIGGNPSWETQDINVHMTGSEIISTSAIQNMVTRASGALSMGSGGVTENSVYTAGQPVIFVQYWNATTDAIVSIVNGTEVTEASVSPSNKTFTILGCAVFVPDSAGGSNLGSIFDGANLFTNAGSPARWFDGKLGEMGIVYWPNNEGPTTDEVDKLVGGLAHKWDLTSVLPVDHPYKVTVPKLWE